MIVIENISKSHGPILVLNQISLRLEPGETVALMGHSGSGKTSLIRLIAGLDQPDAGRLLVKGRIGMVFQSLALWPHLTAREQLALVLHEPQWTAESRKNRVAELLDLVGMTLHSHRKPGMLSGGEQQRIALARALAPDPDILLLDEPLAHLDPEIRTTLRSKLLHYLKGKTVVIATHDESDANILASRKLILKGGSLQ